MRILQILLALVMTLPLFATESHPRIKMTDEQSVLELYQLMKDVHEVLQKNDITYWLEGGTLLGAVRHNGIIPWDNDLDICIDVNDEERLLALMPTFYDLGFKRRDFHWGYKLSTPSGTALDIFLAINLEGKIIYLSENIREFYGMRDGGPLYLTPEELFPLKDYIFGEILVKGPNMSYPYLDSAYKNWDTEIRLQIDHVYNIYDPQSIPLTPELSGPALPTGPLQDRVR